MHLCFYSISAQRTLTTILFLTRKGQSYCFLMHSKYRFIIRFYKVLISLEIEQRKIKCVENILYSCSKSYCLKRYKKDVGETTQTYRLVRPRECVELCYDQLRNQYIKSLGIARFRWGINGSDYSTLPTWINPWILRTLITRVYFKSLLIILSILSTLSFFVSPKDGINVYHSQNRI